MHAVYEPPLWITQETSRANPDFHHGLLGGSITVLHNFDANGAPLDGWEPLTLILATDGNFYGTTRWGAVDGGVLFRITPSGAYSVLYNFDDTHGSAPVTIPMQHTNGELYGLTEF